MFRIRFDLCILYNTDCLTFPFCREKPCRYFAEGTGTCPFGSSCFYKHGMSQNNFCKDDGVVLVTCMLSSVERKLYPHLQKFNTYCIFAKWWRSMIYVRSRVYILWRKCMQKNCRNRSDRRALKDLATRLDDSVFAPPKQLEASEACVNDHSNDILVIQKCFADEKEEDKTEEELRTSEFLISCAFCFSLSRWKSRGSKVKAL